MPQELPEHRPQIICCDATSPHLSEQLRLYYKCSYHDMNPEQKVRVDFSLHVLRPPAQPLGIWRCRVIFWLSSHQTQVHNDTGFDFYVKGFRLAMQQAEEFLAAKYRLKTSLPPATIDELRIKYERRLQSQKRDS